MKAIIKYTALLLCFVFAFSFTACKDDGDDDSGQSETMALAIAKVNAAIDMVYAENVTIDATIETTETLANFPTTTTRDIKVKDGEQVHIQMTTLGIVSDHYYLDGCHYNNIYFGTIESNLNDFFRLSNVYIMSHLYDSDISSWSRSVQDGKTIYRFNLNNTNFYGAANYILGHYTYERTDFSISLDTSFDSNGVIEAFNFFVSFKILDKTYSVLAITTINSLNNDVIVNIPSNVIEEVAQYKANKTKNDAILEHSISKANAAFV